MKRGMMKRAIVGLSAGIVLSVSAGAPPVFAQSDKDRPVALVESVALAPKAGVEFLDYVFPGQEIELGPTGEIVLSYFSSCRHETARGGRLTVQKDAGKIEDGKITSVKAPCQGSKVIVAKETGEAGASVTRATSPFQGQDWSEWTIKSAHPVFKWRVAGEVNVKVIDLDNDPPKTLWAGSGTGKHLAYPTGAPPLKIGFPYEVQVSINGGKMLKAVFSIDPDLEGPDTVLSRIVLLGR